MNHLFVPYELALKLKQMGFDEPCLGFFNPHTHELDMWNDEWCSERTNKWFIDFEEKFPKVSKDSCTAPLYQQAIDFFREKHSLMGIILPFGEGLFDYRIYSRKQGEHLYGSKEFNTYEEAQLECLRKLIEIAKK